MRITKGVYFMMYTPLIHLSHAIEICISYCAQLHLTRSNVSICQ